MLGKIQDNSNTTQSVHQESNTRDVLFTIMTHQKTSHSVFMKLGSVTAYIGKRVKKQFGGFKIKPPD